MSKLDFIKSMVYKVEAFIPCCAEVAFFIACQSALETGYGSSELYLNYFNAFGMRKVSKRISTSYCSYRGHQCYSHPSYSVVDYMLWLQMAGFNKDDLFSLEKFCSKMRKSNYNPSPKYVDTILTIYNTYYHE